MKVKKQDPSESQGLELTDDELENVAGGKGKKAQGKKATVLQFDEADAVSTPGHKLV